MVTAIDLNSLSGISHSIFYRQCVLQNLIEKHYLSWEEKTNCFSTFDESCSVLKHKKCVCCRSVSISLKGLPVSGVGVCQTCKPYKDKNYFLKNHLLPVWYKNGDTKKEANFNIPQVLSCLTQAEKMLIQRVSLFLPLHHLKNGTCGIQGHVCAFEQDVNEFVKRLPRSKGDTALLRVVKQIKTEVGSTKRSTRKAFKVRKIKVEEGMF